MGQVFTFAILLRFAMTKCSSFGGAGSGRDFLASPVSRVSVSDLPKVINSAI